MNKKTRTLIAAFAIAASNASFADNSPSPFNEIKGSWVSSIDGSQITVNFKECGQSICGYIESVDPKIAAEWSLSDKALSGGVNIITGLHTNEDNDELINGKFLNVTDEDAINCILSAEIEREDGQDFLTLTASAQVFSKNMEFYRKGDPKPLTTAEKAEKATIAAINKMKFW